MFRHQKDGDSSKRIIMTPPVTVQANKSTASTQYAQNEDQSGSMSWSNSNHKLRKEPKIKCEKEFGNLAHSNLHRATRHMERPAQQYMNHDNSAHPKSSSSSQKLTSLNHSESVGVMIGLNRYQQAVNSAKIKKRNQCTECGKSFYHKRALIAHKRIHAGGMHQCYACEKSFRMKAHLANHQRIHVKEPTLETQMGEENTPDCQKNVNQEGHSMADLRIDTKERIISESESHALQRTDPITRLETQEGEKPYKCDICEKCFGQKVNMLAHLRTHRGEKPYQCTTCNRRYCMKGHLLAHQRAHACQKVLNLQKRTKKEKLVLATECKKGSIQNGDTLTNIKHEVRKHKCKDCEKTFHGRASLLAHIRVHTGEKPHQCVVCKKCFSQKGYLKIHIRTHTGERPYRCTKCAKGFTTKGNLDSHKKRCVSENIPDLEMPPAKKIIIQSTEPEKGEAETNIKKPEDERPYICTVCDKRFHQMGGLVVHSRIHTGEKPYKCSKCDKQFCQKGNLKTHMSSWH